MECNGTLPGKAGCPRHLPRFPFPSREGARGWVRIEFVELLKIKRLGQSAPLKGGENMGNLSFSPEQARGVAKSIDGKGNSARDIVNQLDREIKSVEGWWQGDSAKAFIDEFNQLKPSLDKLVECVHNISIQLNKVADIKEQSERDMAAQLRK
ncbi:MAG TPA: WXG100 family type VII secretion target [Clostridia bacterium]